MSQDKGKPIPAFANDEELELWFDTADLSEYDLSGFRPFSSEFRMKDARVNMRLPTPLLTRLKAVAAEEKVPYQRLMRDLLERGLAARQAAPEATRKKAS